MAAVSIRHKRAIDKINVENAAQKLHRGTLSFALYVRAFCEALATRRGVHILCQTI
jgi:hypothetical protein